MITLDGGKREIEEKSPLISFLMYKLDLSGCKDRNNRRMKSSVLIEENEAGGPMFLKKYRLVLVAFRIKNGFSG